MPNFFDGTLQEQVYEAIDKNDSELLQVLLGPKYCQLWKYWLMHSMLCYDMTVITKTLNYQLPMNILAVQSQVLAKTFPSVYCEIQEYINGSVHTGEQEEEDLEPELNQVLNLSAQERRNYRATKDQANQVNKQLQDVEQEVLKKYKDIAYDNQTNHNCKTVGIRPMFDPIRKFNYHYNLGDYDEGNHCIQEAIEKYSDDLSLQHVMKLDLTENYHDMYREALQKVIEKYRLRIKEGDIIHNLYSENGTRSLSAKNKELEDRSNFMDEVIDNTIEIINKIKAERFIEEMHEQLLLNIGNRGNNNLFSIEEQKKNAASTREEKIEEIKKRVKTNNDYVMLNKFLEYAVARRKPEIEIINVLIVNGASLLNSYFTHTVYKRLITVKEHFLNNLKGRYARIVDKSIYTVMKDVNKLLFKSSIMKDDINIMDIISGIPSKEGDFSKKVEEVCIFNKIGEDGAKEFISLVKNSIDKYIHNKEYSSAKDMWLKKICVTLFSSKREEVEAEDYKYACKKLYEILNIGYLAIVTGDDRVTLDYLEEIDDEIQNSKNPVIRELYDDFKKLVKENKELPKSMFLVRWCNYFCRTAKSYTWEWEPAWEKILTGPGYNTEVGEWSKKQFEEIAQAERDKIEIKVQQGERARQEAEGRAEEEKERAEQEKERAEQEKERAEEEKRGREEEAKARQEAEGRAEQIKEASKFFIRKVLRCNNEELRDLIIGHQDGIIEAAVKCAMEGKVLLEEVVDIVIEGIETNSKEVIKEGVISNELIQSGIERFLSYQSTLLNDISVSQAAMSQDEGYGEEYGYGTRV